MITPPTPAIAPSVIRSRRSPGGIAVLTVSASEAMRVSIPFIGPSARVKMLRKSNVITVPSTAQPQNGWVATESILSEALGPTVPSRRTTSAAIWPIAS